MTRLLFRLIALPVAVAALAACNTIEGAGQDVQAGGQAVENAAENAEDELSE